MTKEQALHSFWSGFGLTAYDETSVPSGENAPNLPYISYELAVATFNTQIALSASLWQISTSWREITEKANEIEQKLKNGCTIPYDGGLIFLTAGTPFMQRMSDPDERVRRIYINLNAEYLG